MCRIWRKPLYTPMRPLLIIKCNELVYLLLCLFNITKTYLPFIRKLLFYCFVDSLRYCIFQWISRLGHTNLHQVLLKGAYIFITTVLNTSVAMVYQWQCFILPGL